jgi:hypothetical protein
MSTDPTVRPDKDLPPHSWIPGLIGLVAMLGGCVALLWVGQLISPNAAEGFLWIIAAIVGAVVLIGVYILACIIVAYAILYLTPIGWLILIIIDMVKRD